MKDLIDPRTTSNDDGNEIPNLQVVSCENEVFLNTPKNFRMSQTSGILKNHPSSQKNSVSLAIPQTCQQARWRSVPENGIKLSPALTSRYDSSLYRYEYYRAFENVNNLETDTNSTDLESQSVMVDKNLNAITNKMSPSIKQDPDHTLAKKQIGPIESNLSLPFNLNKLTQKELKHHAVVNNRPKSKVQTRLDCKSRTNSLKTINEWVKKKSISLKDLSSIRDIPYFDFINSTIYRRYNYSEGLKIDRKFRFWYMVAFLVFNLAYWSYYLAIAPLKY